jgi:hypothetical protein
MSRTVTLLADTLGFMAGGGHFWVYLNWALGLQGTGCAVHWLDSAPDGLDTPTLHTRTAVLRERLAALGFHGQVAVVGWTSPDPDIAPPAGCIGFGDVAASSDLVINFTYAMPDSVLKRFKRTALIDIDPGLTQHWLASGQMSVRPHDIFFSTGETVGRSALIPDAGLHWHYTPPCVALDAWPALPPPQEAPFTTVSGWYANEWITDASHPEGFYCNDKRSGFLPFLDLPQHTPVPLELALNMDTDADTEGPALRAKGWRVRLSKEVSSTPADYRRYIQSSRGEFSAAKPSCMAFQNAWISDRTLCYLASGRPAVVRHTGPSHFLPDALGLLRFHTLQQAAEMLDEVAANWARHSAAARALAAEHFDATRVAQRVLERALG